MATSPLLTPHSLWKTMWSYLYSHKQTVVRELMPLQINCEYVSLLSKRDFAGVIKVNSGKAEITPDYRGGANVITGLLNSREPLPAVIGGGHDHRRMARKRLWCCLWIKRKRPQPKEYGWPLEVGKDKETDCRLKHPEKNAALVIPSL